MLFMLWIAVCISSFVVVPHIPYWKNPPVLNQSELVKAACLSPLFQGESGLMGPGVIASIMQMLTFQIWVSVVVLISFTFLSLYVVDEPTIIHSLLAVSRITRMFLSTCGLMQFLRTQLSFYHAMALSMLLQLLAAPDYLIIFLRLPRSRTRSLFTEHVLKICGSGFSILLTLLIAAQSVQLQGLDRRCLTPANSLTTLQKDPGYYRQVIPSYQTMLYYMTFDGFFIIFLILDGYEDIEVNVRGWQYRPFSLAQRFVVFAIAMHAGFVARSMILLIQELKFITEGSQASWGFAQILTMSIFGCTIGWMLLQYAADIGTMDVNVPRYIYWFRRSNIHVVLSNR